MRGAGAPAAVRRRTRAGSAPRRARRPARRRTRRPRQNAVLSAAKRVARSLGVARRGAARTKSASVISASARLPTCAPAGSGRDRRELGDEPAVRRTRAASTTRRRSGTAQAHPSGAAPAEAVGRQVEPHGGRAARDSCTATPRRASSGSPRSAKRSIARRRCSRSHEAGRRASRAAKPRDVRIAVAHRARCRSSRTLRVSRLDPVVALLLELERQLLAAGLHDAAARRARARGPARCSSAAAGSGSPGSIALSGRRRRVDARRRRSAARRCRGPSRSRRGSRARLEHRHLEDLVALLLAAREALVDRRGCMKLSSISTSFIFSFSERQELHRVDARSPRCLRIALTAALQEVGVAHARDLDRVLERQEHARRARAPRRASRAGSCPS